VTAGVLLWMVCVVLVLLVVCGISAMLTDGCWGRDDDDWY